MTCNNSTIDRWYINLDNPWIDPVNSTSFSSTNIGSVQFTVASIALVPSNPGPGPGPGPGPSPGPHEKITYGLQKKDDFGLEYELVNILSWSPSPVPVVGYKIYRENTLIATLSSATLEYEDHDIKRGVTFRYEVKSYGITGLESPPLIIEVLPLK